MTMKRVKKVTKGLLSAILAFLLTMGFSVAVFADGRTCYVNDEENHVYACGQTAGKRIALTFDDGPHPKYTDQILDVLGRYGVKATFFVVGQNAVYYPKPLERTISEGHSVGGHTFSHAHVKSMSGQQLRSEFEKTEKTLEGFGVHPGLFRPPEGVCDRKVIDISREYQCDVILWTIDTGDWRSPSKEHIVSSVLEHIRGGEIILMHDYVSGKSNTPAALEVILPQLLKDGYEFVTVEELIGRTK